MRKRFIESFETKSIILLNWIVKLKPFLFKKTFLIILTIELNI